MSKEKRVAKKEAKKEAKKQKKIAKQVSKLGDFKYESLPNKADKMEPIENDVKFSSLSMQGSPFKLGSNRGNTSYSGFQAKGLITPIQNKEGEEEMKQGYRGKSDSQKAKDLKKEKQQAKKAAELTFTTRFKESGLSLAEYKKTKEGAKLVADIQQRAAEIQGYQDV